MTVFKIALGMKLLSDRVINGVKKESLLDHVYVKNISSVINTSYEVSTFGDHVIVMASLSYSGKIDCNGLKQQKRCWKNYSIPLISLLSAPCGHHM